MTENRYGLGRICAAHLKPIYENHEVKPRLFGMSALEFRSSAPIEALSAGKLKKPGA